MKTRTKLPTYRTKK